MGTCRPAEYFHLPGIAIVSGVNRAAADLLSPCHGFHTLITQFSSILNHSKL
ncbi:hypothetical protein ANACOL_00567 [Anaerotruncus colihominis DSM 17241]|uniref:Uncharacterized protein n=1 Tax=Anaerotruncus colihominis DSM 17241 TaxID=445972 RepID=B0P739_9FIRM|nr:hypothetical protein ANACOL_00567 [Anaerotruncus colihominis DSM 17241]